MLGQRMKMVGQWMAMMDQGKVLVSPPRRRRTEMAEDLSDLADPLWEAG